MDDITTAPAVDDELAALEKEVDGEFAKMMAMDDKGHPSERKPCEKAAPLHPSLAGIPKSNPVSSPEPKSNVTGNLASGMDELLPSELYDPEVESKVADGFSKMSDEEFEKLLKSAEFHPDFPTYVRIVKM